MLKKIITIACCFCAIAAFGGISKATTLTCNVHDNTGAAVFLYKVENGEAVSMGFKRPGEDNTCTFSFNAKKEGVYYLRKGGTRQLEYNYVIYLKPGDNKIAEIYTSRMALDFDSCKILEPNLETKYLQGWTNQFYAICKLGVNRRKREQFFKAYADFVATANQLKNKCNTSNKYFNHLFAAKIDAEIEYPKVAAFFNFTERMNSEYDSSAAHQYFYQTFAGQQFCSAGLLYSEQGMQLLNYWIAFNLLKQSGNQAQMLATPFATKAKMICNDTVRGAYTVQRILQLNKFEQVLAETEPFKQYIKTPELKEAYQNKYNQLFVFVKGAPAYDFSLSDANGQLFTLSGFKGKIVVVDMWAMWCGSCLAEKPFYQKIEDEYKDRKDILFIGVSVDGVNRKEIWKNFIAKKGYKNLELISNPTESIMKYYKIEGIPRFMIFDKEGKIVSVDAPRPSKPEFKALIDQTISSYSN